MALFPFSGRMVSEKKDPLIRETIVGSYRIIYQVDETSEVVAIVRIWRSAPRSAGVLGYHVKELEILMPKDTCGR
jgi:plasmid stabilization system protein ParE